MTIQQIISQVRQSDLSGFSCGLDAVLLSTPDYEDSLRLAHKPYHVFKYADRPVLQFQCQLTLCLKYDGGCAGITPPRCPETHAHAHAHDHQRRRMVMRHKSKRDLVYSQVTATGAETLDVFTRPLMVVDEQLAAQLDQCGPVEAGTAGPAPLWLALAAALTLLNLTAALATVLFWCRRRFRARVDFKH